MSKINGFSLGIFHDKDDNFNRNWWPENDYNNFDSRFRCLINQYTKKFKGYDFSGAKTLGENIADMTGLLAAFGAFLQKLYSGKGVFSVPGYESYTPQQSLFITYGTVSWVF
jgi:predicted metalloendopeptidase